MPLANTNPQPVRVWFATLAQADLSMRAWLDDRELERLARYQADADRARFLLGAAILRAAAGSSLGVPPGKVSVHRGCAACGRWHGRPVVRDTPLVVSVSHGGLLVALALANNQAVGIDVERLGSRDVDDVRRWTRSEARFKAGGGTGLVVEELTAPIGGHIVTLASAGDATVQLLDSGTLLAAAGAVAPPTDKPRSA